MLLITSCPIEGTENNAEPAWGDMVAPLCSILAELAQNSPACQQEALKLVPTLINVIKSRNDSATRTKAVYALSGTRVECFQGRKKSYLLFPNISLGILRGNERSEAATYLLPEFDKKEDEKIISDGAIDVLVKLVVDSDEAVAVRIKAAFLLSCLAEQRHDVRQLLSRHYEKEIRDLAGLQPDLK